MTVRSRVQQTEAELHTTSASACKEFVHDGFDGLPYNVFCVYRVRFARLSFAP